MRQRVRRQCGLFVAVLALLFSCATAPATTDTRASDTPDDEAVGATALPALRQPDDGSQQSGAASQSSGEEPDAARDDPAETEAALPGGPRSPARSSDQADQANQIDPAYLERAVERVLSRMTLRERIGQRFISFVPGSSLRDGAHEIIRTVGPAGFIVYPWNFEDAEEARILINTLQFVANAYSPGLSLFIAADQEGGRVRAFRFPEMVTLPPAATLGELNDPDLIAAASYLNSRQLRSFGVNMNFAPVLDLFSVADDSIIGDRSFGDDPSAVSSFVGPFLEASRRAGVIATAKHFPGHGVTTVDSHLELPVVRMSRARLAERPLVPFVRAIEQGVPAIMTAHLVFADIDPDYPVTISEVFMHEILRGQLGYEGVVITDGLEMGAMSDNFDVETTLVRLFRYDVDLILLYTRYDIIEVVETVERLVAEGLITPESIDRGVRRVLRLKLQYGLLAPGIE